MVTPEDEKIALMSNFTIDYLQGRGLYNLTWVVILRKDTDICGKNIYRYRREEDYMELFKLRTPSTVLAVHGTKTRGLHPSPIMCEEEIDDLEEESFVDNDKSSSLCPIVPILVQEEERICYQ